MSLVREVHVRYEGRNTYLISEKDAPTAEEAMELARNRYLNGDNGDCTSAEWENVVEVTVSEVFEGVSGR